MKTQTMAEVAELLRAHNYQRDQDLPLPNVYWCSVDMPGFGQFHEHLASDHTTAAVKKMANYCAEHHGFRPYRSNSQMKVRRLKLGDLIEYPDAHRIALANAVAAGESDTVAALLKLPAWIHSHVLNHGRTLRTVQPASAANDAWERLTLEINSMGLAASA